VLSALSATLALSSLDAQQRVDFSGAWTAQGAGRGGAPAGGAAGGRGGGAPTADLSSGWGPSITILQRGDTLTVERVFFTTGDLQPPLKLRYALNGSAITNTVMMGRGMQESVSTAAWQGERLLITTRQSVPDPADGRPVTVEVVRTLSLQRPANPSPASPTLVIETVRSSAFGGTPSTTRTVYTRG
jgi:hypothetical protein